MHYICSVEIMKKIPFWLPKKNNAIWYVIFFLIFLSSQDYWQWNNNNPLIFGLPIWVIYILILTILTSFAYYIFTKFYWSDKTD
jgi:hypothetical protein